MIGPIVTLLLCLVVIVVAGASYRRHGGSEAPTNPRLAILAALLVAMAALGAYFLYRHPG